MGTARDAKDALFEGFAVVGRALSSGRRLEILDVLAQGHRSVDDLSRELGQSVATTSHHLRVLAASGLVRGSRRGKNVIYRLAGRAVEDLWESVRRVAAEQVATIDRLAADYLGDRDKLEVVTRAELHRRLRRGEITVLDVRPLAEYEAGHVPGARWVAPGTVTVAKLVRHLPAGADVVAYCRGPYCVYADDAVRQLIRRGYRARRLEEGFPEWRRAGLPVEGKEAG